MEKPKCRICGKTIRRWTANKYKDWKKRKACKKCWKEERDTLYWKAQYERFVKEQHEEDMKEHERLYGKTF